MTYRDIHADIFMEKNQKDVNNRQIAQIYDRIFKKILTLSTRAVIGLLMACSRRNIRLTA